MHLCISIRQFVQSEKTPLYVASREGHNKVVEVLIKAGADVNFVIKDVSYINIEIT